MSSPLSTSKPRKFRPTGVIQPSAFDDESVVYVTKNPKARRTPAHLVYVSVPPRTPTTPSLKRKATDPLSSSAHKVSRGFSASSASSESKSNTENDEISSQRSSPTPEVRPAPRTKESSTQADVSRDQKDATQETEAAALSDSMMPLHIAKLEAGISPPWAVLTLERVRKHFDSGESSYKFNSEWRDLIQEGVEQWRSEFATIAADIVRRFLKARLRGDFETPKKVREIIDATYSLVGRTRPFWWKHWTADASGAIKKQGRLENPLIIEIFARGHLVNYYRISDAHIMSLYPKPHGALILAAQALENALKAWETGSYIDNSKEFTADNYGDRVENQLLFDIYHPRTKIYLDCTESFTDEKWAKIFIAAGNVLGKGRIVLYTGETDFNMESD